MSQPDPFDALAYVTAAAPAIGIALSPARAAEVAAAFAMMHQAAAPALAFTLPPDTEPAPLFDPVAP